MLTVDDRCDLSGHELDPIYRMVGRCGNCKANPVLILQTVRHHAYSFRCPVCGRNLVIGGEALRPYLAAAT